MTATRYLLLMVALTVEVTAARAQSISGYTTLDIDPASGIVTATCETDLDPYTDGYYEASTRCTVKDASGAVIASDQNTDIDGDFGYAQVILTFTGTPGTTYTATGTHYGVVSIPYDLADTRPGQNFYQYDDYYNFSLLNSNPPQIYTGSYSWYGAGPDTATRITNLRIGNTTESGTVPYPCPISITLNSLTPISITSDPNLRTGYGAMASMWANPTTTDWSSAVITETVTPGMNSCPNPGSLQPAFQTITLANSATFSVGQGSLTLDYPQSQVSFPAIPGAFYDEHSVRSGTVALGTGTCSAYATQTYVCGGNTLGTFTIIKTFTAGTANGGPATIVTVTKQ